MANILRLIWEFPLTRVGLFIVALVGLIVVVAEPVAGIVFTLFQSSDQLAFLLMLEVLQAAIALLVLWLFVRYVDRRTLESAGLAKQGAVREVLAGFVLGAILVTTVVGAMSMAGIYHFRHVNAHNQIFTALIFFFFAASVEELVFRGYIFQAMEKKWGSLLGLVLTSLLFGFAHIINAIKDVTPEQTLFFCFALALEAGILLNAAYLWNRRLWLPIGMHWAWNFFEGSIYGMNVSGNEFGQPLMHAELVGSFLETGGKFGPEASLIGIGLGTVFGCAFLWWVIRHGNWMSFARARKEQSGEPEDDKSPQKTIGMP